MYGMIGVICGSISVLSFWGFILYVVYCYFKSYSAGLDKIYFGDKDSSSNVATQEFDDFSVWWCFFLFTFGAMLIFVAMSLLWAIFIPAIAIHVWAEYKRDKALGGK